MLSSNTLIVYCYGYIVCVGIVFVYDVYRILLLTIIITIAAGCNLYNQSWGDQRVIQEVQ